MGLSSSFVEQHEFLDVFLQPFSFKPKAECHVQESSGKYSERGVGSGETETNEFGVKEPPECEEKSSARSSDSNSPGNQELDQSFVSSTGRKLMRNINQDPTAFSQWRRQDDTHSSSTRKQGRRDEPSSSASARKLERGEDIQVGRSKVGIPQHADLRPSIPRESLHEPAEKVESRRRGTSIWYRSFEDQRVDRQR